MISHETFNLICWIWIAIAVIIFPLLLKVTQPYGRHSKKNFGPMINNRLGWFVMELPALSFLIWTIINLTTRALDHHRWYIKEFPEYDKDRRALIPFLL